MSHFGCRTELVTLRKGGGHQFRICDQNDWNRVPPSSAVALPLSALPWLMVLAFSTLLLRRFAAERGLLPSAYTASSLLKRTRPLSEASTSLVSASARSDQEHM